MLLTFAWRHLIRHWRTHLALLLGLVLCAALLAGLPMYAAIVAGTSLAESLTDAYAVERNFEVRGDDLTADDRQMVRQDMGDLVERIVESLRQPEHVHDERRHLGSRHRAVGAVLIIVGWVAASRDTSFGDPLDVVLEDALIVEELAVVDTVQVDAV